VNGATAGPPLLETRDLTTHFRRGGWLQPTRILRAVDGVSIGVARQETLGLVGESGSGKTTLGRTILRLVEPTAGRVFLDGQDITALPQAALRPIRRRMQIIFQNPYASLNPRRSVGSIVGQPLAVHAVPGDHGRMTPHAATRTSSRAASASASRSRERSRSVRIWWWRTRSRRGWT
jgi:oligopeptide transport system ATP-binding protein